MMLGTITNLPLAGNSLKVFTFLLGIQELVTAASDFKSGFKNRMAPLTAHDLGRASSIHDPNPDSPDADWTKVDLNHPTRKPLLWQVWLPDRECWAEPKFHVKGADGKTDSPERVQIELTKMWIKPKKPSRKSRMYGGIKYKDPPHTVEKGYHQTLKVSKAGTFYQQWSRAPGDKKLPVLCPDALEPYLRQRKINKPWEARGGVVLDDWKDYTVSGAYGQFESWLKSVKSFYKQYKRQPMMCPTCGALPSKPGKDKWQGVYCCYWCRGYSANMKSFEKNGYYRSGNGHKISQKPPTQHQQMCGASRKPDPKRARKPGPEKVKKVPTCKSRNCKRLPRQTAIDRYDDKAYCCFWCKNYKDNVTLFGRVGFYLTGNGHQIATYPKQHHPDCH